MNSPLHSPVRNPVNEALTLQFLTFVAAQPRSYGETMEAWRTSCPRLSIWEDAVRDDLVRLQRAPGQPMNHAAVVLTAKGADLLAEHGGRPGHTRLDASPARAKAPAAG